MRFLRAKVSVALPKIATCREPEREGPVEAALVGHQHGEVDAVGAQARHQLLGVGQLRHPARVHEAGRLDDRQPGGEEPAYELLLDLDGHQGLLVLQAVARSDLVDRHALGQPRDVIRTER